MSVGTCPHCGGNANVGYTTCPHCGKALVWKTVTPKPATPEQKRRAKIFMLLLSAVLAVLLTIPVYQGISRRSQERERKQAYEELYAKYRTTPYLDKAVEVAEQQWQPPSNAIPGYMEGKEFEWPKYVFSKATVEFKEPSYYRAPPPADPPYYSATITYIEMGNPQAGGASSKRTAEIKIPVATVELTP